MFGTESLEQVLLTAGHLGQNSQRLCSRGLVGVPGFGFEPSSQSIPGHSVEPIHANECLDRHALDLDPLRFGPHGLVQEIQPGQSSSSEAIATETAVRFS